MKVTAILPDKLISEVRQRSRGKNITESLLIALTEWVQLQRVHRLNLEVREKPLEFKSGYSAGTTRSVNRRHGDR